MKHALLFTALLGCAATAVFAAEGPVAGKAVQPATEAAIKAVAPPNTPDELKAWLNDNEDADVEKGAHNIVDHKKLEKENKWADSVMGLAKKAVMTFTDLGFGPVADAYLGPLGITWTDTVTRRLRARRANPPTPPEVARFEFAVDQVVDGSFTSNDGLIKEVSFYYATPNIVFDLIKHFPKSVFAKPTVTAWTGPAGTGKKLETMELPWTKGDLRLNFEEIEFKFKGVAKSISFTVPTWDDVKFFNALYLDNVEILAPAGKTKVLAAGALEIEEKFAEIEYELHKTLDEEHKD